MTLGLLPGGGGVVRTVRMLGVADAVVKVLAQGQKYRPAEARELGLVDEVVASIDQLLPTAKAWIAANPDAVQPWDVKGHRIPGGTPSSPAFAANLPAFPANLRKQLKGAHYPAPRAILAAAVEGTQVDVDTALDIESRYLVSLVTGQVSKNMIKAFFFDLNTITAGGSRPQGFPKHAARKVAVLGAGMMGAGIAYVCARAGIEVVLKDVSIEAAEKGKAYSAGSSRRPCPRALHPGRGRRAPRPDHPGDRRRGPGRRGPGHRGRLRERRGQAAGLRRDRRHRGARRGARLEHLDPAHHDPRRGGQAPGDFIGLHFFSPVDKMPLLEIIAGNQTSDETLAKAFDLALQIKKTPIVVNDHRGFFTSRVIGTFLNEAIAMVGEGVPAASVEQAGLQAGYPAAPLQLADELNLSLMSKIQKETRVGLEADPTGRPYEHHAAYEIVDAMIAQGRTGKLGGAGFYEYEDGKRVGLWHGLADTYGASTEIPFEDMKERMLFAEALETVKCFDEGVLRSVEDANIGSILGIGFPAWTGGVVQYVEGYPGGTAGFVARARQLAERYGDRFLPPASLVARAEAAGSAA